MEASWLHFVKHQQAAAANAASEVASARAVSPRPEAGRGMVAQNSSDPPSHRTLRGRKVVLLAPGPLNMSAGRNSGPATYPGNGNRAVTGTVKARLPNSGAKFQELPSSNATHKELPKVPIDPKWLTGHLIATLKERHREQKAARADANTLRQRLAEAGAQLQQTKQLLQEEQQHAQDNVALQAEVNELSQQLQKAMAASSRTELDMRAMREQLQELTAELQAQEESKTAMRNELMRGINSQRHACHAESSNNAMLQQTLERQNLKIDQLQQWELRSMQLEEENAQLRRAVLKLNSTEMVYEGGSVIGEPASLRDGSLSGSEQDSAAPFDDLQPSRQSTQCEPVDDEQVDVAIDARLSLQSSERIEMQSLASSGLAGDVKQPEESIRVLRVVVVSDGGRLLSLTPLLTDTPTAASAVPSNAKQPVELLSKGAAQVQRNNMGMFKKFLRSWPWFSWEAVDLRC